MDGVSDHKKWSEDIEASQGHAINFPLIGDPELNAVKLYDHYCPVVSPSS